MASINTGKVIVGGLVAGVVANAIDFVTNTYVLAPDWTAFAQGHNLDPNAMTNPVVGVTWMAIDFVLGWMMVWTYAAVRPRLGPGAGTAAIVGLLFFLVPTIVLFGFTQMGLMSMTMFVKGSCGAIVSTLAAAVAGAAVYTEASSPSYAKT